jgi:hypothetical protein
MRRALALSAVTAFLLPHVFGLAIGAHLALEHDHEEPEHAGSLETAFHGHTHDHDTPAHEHYFSSAVSLLGRILRHATTLPALAAPTAAVDADAAARLVSGLPAPSPPVLPPRSPVLRI